MPTPFPRADGRPLVLGHRGASADAPENTMAAFRLALARGADGVELDVWRCSSGEVVVIHDRDALRTTGVPHHIARTPWSELRRLDAGAWKADRFVGERIPLLSEVLEALPDAIVNVELKGDGGGDARLAVAVAKVLRDPKVRQRVLVSSFDPLLLAQFRTFSPRVATGMLFGSDAPWRTRAFAGRLLRVSAMHPDRALATPERVRAWKAAGYGVVVWTVDGADEVAAACAAGADVIVSDRPDVARYAVRDVTGR